MTLWLLQLFPNLLRNAPSDDSEPIFLTARIAASSLIAFVVALLLGPIAIRWLQNRFTERIASASETLNELHADKQDTPTMGGLFVMLAVLMAVLICGDLSQPFIQIGILTIISSMVLGFYDDRIKQSTTRLGLSARQKFCIQIVMAACISALLWFGTNRSVVVPDVRLPMTGIVLLAGIPVIAWMTFVIVGAENSVNLTDGLDGLAAGPTIFCAGSLAVVTYLCGHAEFARHLHVTFVSGSGELSVLLAALVGAMLGFLWFNTHPALVFLGDTGSLPTGALIGYCAVACGQEWLLLVIGGLFVVETASVIIQVAGYKLTGKRVLKCSPLHNHFVFCGEPEARIVIRFWIISAVLAIVGLGLLRVAGR